MTRVAVVGLGYVGLPLAVRAAEVGHTVIGLDVDEKKIASLKEGTTYIEDVTDEQLKNVSVSSGFTPILGSTFADRPRDEIHCFDIGIITVPTPMRGTEPDLSYVESAGRLLGKALCKGSTVVLESTTYPGTTDGLLAKVLEEESGLIAGVNFHLGFSPERIDPGNKEYTLYNTPKLVSGTTPEGLNVIETFYRTIVAKVIPVSSPRVAELAKLFENIQAYVNIGLSNEMAGICADLGVDFWEVLDAAMTKGHSVARWTPGPGVGGHCLPIDPLYLAWQSREHLGRPFEFAELADKINKARPIYVADRAAELLDLNDTEVLVLGVAYKPDVGDVRESPAMDVVTALRNRGASVVVADPYVEDWSLTPMLPMDELYGELGRFSLVVVVTDHAVFDYEKIVQEARLVLDTRHSVPVAKNVVSL